MLLEKNFNISKSNKPLKDFLADVLEFKAGERTIESWAKQLELEMPQVNPVDVPVEALLDLFNQRTQKIKRDLDDFARGAAVRVDL